jgi:hypothetical protein
VVKNSKIKPSDERFRDVKFDDIDNFLNENENENTRKKTTSDMNLFRTYLVLTFRLEFFCLRYRSKLHKNPLNVVGSYSDPSFFLTDNRNVLNFSIKDSAERF